jgi:cytokinin riboside 5'-monophosphate phosphoribohydrolase
VGLLNVAGFFDPLLAWIDRTVEEGFLREQHRQLLIVGDQPEVLVDALLIRREANTTEKWISGEAR